MSTDSSHNSPTVGNQMLDFTPRPSAAFAAAFEAHIDAAMQAENAAQAPRNYIGASRLGEECERKLGYEFHRAPKDEGRGFKGRTLRIFDRGHRGEDAMVARLRLAGFQLVVEKSPENGGGQIGFSTANGLIAGHLDGVLTGGPDHLGDTPLRYPALWENKVLGEKSFSDLVKKGVRASKPVYFVQMQLYMVYLGLADNPGLFTAENGNTGEIYAELVGFDRAAAQAASDKGVRVVTSANPEELPRVAGVKTDFRCKFCDYAARCWAEPERPVVDYESAGSWGGFGTRG